MIDPSVRDLLVCPACHGRLVWASDGRAANCAGCAGSYAAPDDIPALRAPEPLTVDPARLTIKSRDAAVASIRRMLRLDRGLIGVARNYYVVYAGLVAMLAVRWWPGVAALAALLVVDLAVFMVRRARALAEWNANPNRIRTGTDEAAVEDLYRRRGIPRPTMADWIAASLEAVHGRGGGGAGSGAAVEGHGGAGSAAPSSAAAEATPGAETSPGQTPGGFDDERYREILDLCQAMPRPPGIVVDVGCNDGYAIRVIGIGRESRVVGIDISRQLLERFRASLPGQTAVEAHGGRLPLADGAVDFLFCTETLEHLPDPAAALDDFARVLAPGGRLVVQSPNAHRLRNLNILHLLVAAGLGRIDDRLLQKKRVHENTWYDGTTWHWDFSVRDYRGLAARTGLRIVLLHSRDFFCPAALIRGSLPRWRAKERFLRRVPLLGWTGGDLVLVAEKVKPASAR